MNWVKSETQQPPVGLLVVIELRNTGHVRIGRRTVKSHVYLDESGAKFSLGGLRYMWKPQPPEVAGVGKAQEPQPPAGGPRNYRGMRLAGLTFASELLDHADFTDADCEGVDFSHSRLNGAVFTRANLEGAKFDGAQLFGACFRDARCRAATFIGAGLAAANLRGADVQHADFFMANLAGTGCASLQFGRYAVWVTPDVTTVGTVSHPNSMWRRATSRQVLDAFGLADAISPTKGSPQCAAGWWLHWRDALAETIRACELIGWPAPPLRLRDRPKPRTKSKRRKA